MKAHQEAVADHDMSLARPEQDAALERECDALYRAVFGGEAAAPLRREYARAHAAVFGSATPRGRDAELLAAALSEGADLEALEWALRRRDRGNLLTRKMSILLYLVEASPQGYGRFVNASDSRAWALLSLASHGARSLWLRMKGEALLSRFS